MLAEADLAERHRRATGRAHPRYGTGSLMARALARPRRPEPRLDDADYAACLILVLEALSASPPGQNPPGRAPRQPERPDAATPVGRSPLCVWISERICRI